MSKKLTRVQVVELLGGDEALLRALCERQIVPPENLTPEEVERVLVARTLVHELEVNLPGVEVVLRMRHELMETRAQVTRLATKLRETPSLHPLDENVAGEDSES